MNYLVRLDYKGKDFLLNDIEIPQGLYLERVKDNIYFNGIPFCTWRSNVAKNYLIWNGDGCAEQRLYYENIIIFSEREEIWEETIPLYDKYGNIIGETKVANSGRFSPNEIAYMRKTFPDLIKEGSVFSFNDYFYTGSSIEEIKNLANYLI